MIDNNNQLKQKDSTSIKLIVKEKNSDDKKKILLEITEEGVDYLNKLNSNSLGIISLIGPQKSEKSSFANIIIGDKEAFDTSTQLEGIYISGQPIVHSKNTFLLVIDTENLYKELNAKTSYDKQTFILSTLLSSVMIYYTNENITDCINNFSKLAKESLPYLKSIKGKELTPGELPIVFFVLHNINIGSNPNVVLSQFQSLIKDNIIFQKYFKNYKVVSLKNAGNINTRISSLKGLDEIGALDDQDFKQKAKLIKDQIIKDLEPKKINNCNLDGKCLLGLVQGFVDCLNRGESIIVIEQFNNILNLCLSEVVEQINLDFTIEKLKGKMASNTSFEETFLKICETTFTECINEQFDKFKSMPIVKISPSPSVLDGIKLIFRKCLELFCTNIQTLIEQRGKIINDISKADYVIPKQLKSENIEELLNNFSRFINEKILFPLFTPNNNKFQNIDKILQIFKSKICETLEKIAPIIQKMINELAKENNKLKQEYINFKEKHVKEMEQKNNEINELKLNIEKQDRIMKEKELENMNLLNIEKEKVNQLIEQYKLEIKQKDSIIKELNENLNYLNKDSNIENNPNEINNLEKMNLKNIKDDYNYITNILVKYKMLVNKLITDKDFFFEKILIDKSIGNLEKKYPEIFCLLSDKESVENMKINYEKKMEILTNKNIILEENNNGKDKEINDLKVSLEDNKKKIDLLNGMIEEQKNIILNKNAMLSGQEYTINENKLKYKKIEQEKEKEKNNYTKEIDALVKIIEGLFYKEQNKYVTALQNLSQEKKEKIIFMQKNSNRFNKS